MGTLLSGGLDVGLLCVHPQLRIRLMNSMKLREDRASCSYRIGSSCRLFSSKNFGKPLAGIRSKEVRIQENPSVRNSLPEIFQERQKQKKKLSPCNVVRGEVKVADMTNADPPSIIVDVPAVKKRATKTKKLPAVTVNSLTSEKPVSKGVKTRKKETKKSEKVPKGNCKKVQTLPEEVIDEVKKTVRRRKTKAAGGLVSKASQVTTSGGSLGIGKRELKPLYPPSSRSVVVVESATKAKVIQNYLGSMFEVVPSYGHVRDLAGRSGSVRPDDDFSMVWEVPSAAWTHLKSIKVALNG